MQTIFFLISFLFVQNVSAEKPLKWAADSESGAPYTYINPSRPNEYLGFEKDIVEALAAKLHRPQQFVQNSWDGLIPGLQNRNYDIAINGLEITEEKKERVQFSTPYYLTYEQLVVRRQPPGELAPQIKNLKDCYGKSVGTLKFSLAYALLAAERQISILTYESEFNAFQDLKHGRIDAVFLDAPIVKYYAGLDPELEILERPYGEIQYGIALRSEDTTLLKQINQALAALKHEGTLRRILDRHALWNPMLAKAWHDSRPPLESDTAFRAYEAHHKQTFSRSAIIKRYVGFLPMLLKGALVTLGISLASMILAVLIGGIFSIFKMYGHPILQLFAQFYVESFRGTPLLIQLYFIYYGLPHLGLQLSPFTAAVLGLGLNYGANECENYRAGLQSISKAQFEAGLALGMSKFQTIRHVIFPQAFRLVLPPMTNDFIALIKDSSLVSAITMVELTKIYGQLASTYYDFLGTGLLVALLYFLIGYPFVRLARYLELRLSPVHTFGKTTTSGSMRSV